MKLALPVHEGHVSPVFDWARRLLIVIPGGDGSPGSCHSGGAKGCGQVELELGDLSPALRARRLAGLGVDTLICGGVSAPVAAMLESQGIRVMPGISGDVDAVLEAFFAGRLPDPAFAMPGWRGCTEGMQGRRRCRRGRGGGGRGHGPRG